VRSVILERERKLPKKIFIGHGGKSNAWQELRSMLRDWDLDTEEFNEEPTAGISITQRLKSMLENSRFAFLVMTSENLDDHGRWQARLNVIHEIGLFQGRLGTECAIVLRDKSVSTFSNLDGITRMDFEKDQITTLRGEIHRLLIARGVIPADVKPDQKR
jgi:predicted nucleotide-binding protein